MEEEQHFPSPPHARSEIRFPADRSAIPGTVVEFLHRANVDADGNPGPMEQYQGGRNALHAYGWSEWTSGRATKSLGFGAHGGVRLVYRLRDADKPLEERRFAALKAQRLRDGNVRNMWNEITVLKAVKHEHVIDFYAAFVVTPPTGKVTKCQRDDASESGSSLKSDDTKTESTVDEESFAPSPHGDEVWILMQYADAGDLRKEVTRYAALYISEQGSRYYFKQIGSGLAYLHSKEIRHSDLHTGNVLLRYLPDGRTKSCLLCDFGSAMILSLSSANQRAFGFKTEVWRVSRILRSMLTGVQHNPPPVPPHLSDSVKQLLLQTEKMKTTPETVDELLALPWFTDGPAVPPIPDRPRTPMLQQPLVEPETVEPLEAGPSSSGSQLTVENLKRHEAAVGERSPEDPPIPSSSGSRSRKRSPSSSSSSSSASGSTSASSRSSSSTDSSSSGSSKSSSSPESSPKSLPATPRSRKKRRTE